MSKNLILLILCLFLVRPVSGQEANSEGKKSHFSVSVESPLFFEDWGQESVPVLSLNIEYLLITEDNLGWSFNTGYGRRFYSSNLSYFDPYMHTEITKLLGKKRNQFEIGAGFGYAGDIFLNFRFGYRLNIGKRLLFRFAYTPSVYLEQHIDTEEYPPYTAFNSLSLGLGYRFGIQLTKEKWNKNWNWLSGLQLNFQPFFKNYKGDEGYLGEVDLELLVYKANDISINGIIGFGYGKAKYAYNSIPFGVNLLYGSNKHFLETGIKSAWIPIGGNSDGTFFTLQPEIGYRFCPGKHFTVRIAYTPYWWLSDKAGKEHVEKAFINSATIGIGWRFH